MELVGIALSIPVAFVVSALYCLLLSRVVLKFERSIRYLRAASYAVLALFAIEVLLLITLGSVRSSALIGRGFYATHLFIFFSGPPALANILVLRRRSKQSFKWYTVACVCTIFAFLLVLLQYGVSESLYGIE